MTESSRPAPIRTGSGALRPVVGQPFRRRALLRRLDRRSTSRCCSLFAGDLAHGDPQRQTIPVKIVERGRRRESRAALDGGLRRPARGRKAPRRDAQRPPGPVVRNVRAPRVPTLAASVRSSARGPAVDINTASLSRSAAAVSAARRQLRRLRRRPAQGRPRPGARHRHDREHAVRHRRGEGARHVAGREPSSAWCRPAASASWSYRDQGDEYVVKWSDLSFKTDKLRQLHLHTSPASGGGDWEEAVLDGVDAAIHELSWRKKSKKIIVSDRRLAAASGRREAARGAGQRSSAGDGGTLSTIDVTDHLHLDVQPRAVEVAARQQASSSRRRSRSSTRR